MLDYLTKTELLILGVKTDVEPLRKGGGGPIGGIGFEIKGSVISTPVKQEYVKFSPYSIKKMEGKRYYLYKENEKIGKVYFPDAGYYAYKINGIPAGKIVALDGIDALVSAVSRKCIHWGRKRCIFCSIQDNLKDAVVEKNAEMIAEVVKIAYEEDKRRHLTLTTGTMNLRDKGALKLAEVTKRVKEEVDIPIHVQLEPVGAKYLEMLYEAGAESIGIHVETFDNTIRNIVVPAKPDLREFIACWKNAVSIFGEWKVSSWLLIGLGESFESVIRGFKKMAELTVVPFIAPFRPAPSSKLKRPDLRYAKGVYTALSKLRDEYDVKICDFPSGCPRCNGCSPIAEIFC